MLYLFYEVYIMKKNNLKIETTFTIISITLIVFSMIFDAYLDETIKMISYGLAFLIGGFYKAKEGVTETIKNKALNVEILMIMAAIGAFILKNYAEGAILIFIFALSGLLEDYANDKSEKAFTNLLNLAPDTAILLKDGLEKEIKASDLKIGDTVIVKVGSQIPADGRIIEGSTTINESMITGEFLPVDKKTGDMVFSGTLNQSSRFLMTVEKDMKASMVQKIINFVHEAHQNQTNTETFIDKFERIYVYIVILLSMLTMTIPVIFGWWTQADALYRGIVVLVVGSPCALVASVSPAVLSSLSNASRSGILIKGGKHLETLASIDAVMLDKTGTITEGKPEVKEIMLACDDIETAKKVILALEKQSTHPLAKAVVNYLADIDSIDMQSKETPGRGIEGIYENDNWQIGKFDVKISTDFKDKIHQAHKNGYTTIYISKNKELVGFIALTDKIREHVKDTMDELINMNVRTILMTGDNRYTAARIAKESGIKYILSELLPEDKHRHVKALKTSGKTVMMVGDGINDAPALAISDVGVAMGSGTDVSLETADVVFMNNKIENITKTIKLAKRMRQISKQNIIFSITVITLLLLSNVFGLILLPLGVIAHEGSTILVILNSLRLLRK